MPRRYRHEQRPVALGGAAVSPLPEVASCPGGGRHRLQLPHPEPRDPYEVACEAEGCTYRRRLPGAMASRWK